MSFDLLNKVAKSFTLLKNTSFDHRFDLVKFHLTTISQTKPVMASSRGLVVKAEDSWLRDPRFKPPLWRPFYRHHSFGSKLGTKIVENSNLALLSAYKIQLHGTEWIVSLSADWEQSPKTKQKKPQWLTSFGSNNDHSFASVLIFFKRKKMMGELKLELFVKLLFWKLWWLHMKIYF